MVTMPGNHGYCYNKETMVKLPFDTKCGDEGSWNSYSEYQYTKPCNYDPHDCHNYFIQPSPVFNSSNKNNDEKTYTTLRQCRYENYAAYHYDRGEFVENVMECWWIQ